MRSTTRARLALCRRANGLPPVWPQPVDLLQQVRLIGSRAVQALADSVNGGVPSGSSRCAGGGGGELIPQHLMKTHHFMVRQKEAEPAETGIQQAQKAAAIGAEFSPVAWIDRAEHFSMVGRWGAGVIRHLLACGSDLVKKLKQLFRREGSFD